MTDKIDLSRFDKDTEVYHYGRPYKIISIKKTTDVARPGIIAYAMVLQYIEGRGVKVDQR